MKSVRVVGFDDSFRGESCCVVGVITEGNSYIEGIMVERIAVDGFDVTERIAGMIKRSKFRDNIACIFTAGITFGGFNILDIRDLSEELEIPVVVVMRKKPDFDSIFRALKNLDGYVERKKAIEKAGKVFDFGKIFVQFSGCEKEDAERFLRIATLKGNVPECLRVSHLIASAIIHGESKGRV